MGRSVPQRAFVSRQVPSKPGGVLPDDASYSSGRTVFFGVLLGDRLKLSFDAAEVLLLTALRTGGIRELHGARAARRRNVAQLVGRRSSIDHGERRGADLSCDGRLAVVLGVGASISMPCHRPKSSA
jgi:hypothetical protein